MKQAPEHLAELLEPVIEGMGYECVGIEYNPHPKHAVLRIYIDSPNGVLLDDCSKVSHQISGVLDVEDPIPGEYQLEISSPGADRPLFKIGHFQRFLGETVKVQLYAPVDKRKKITGMIQGVDGENIQLTADGQDFTIPFQMISKARLVPKYLLDKGGDDGK
ncbi:MAG: ribosome maturation factor RimP [Gammaproteobacteria bacterium]